MADSNNTERRLLDSIRKAKTGADAKPTAIPTTTEAHRETQPANAPTRKPAPRSTTAKANSASSRTRAAARKTAAAPKPAPPSGIRQAAPSRDRYQHGRRMWPD